MQSFGGKNATLISLLPAHLNNLKHLKHKLDIQKNHA